MTSREIVYKTLNFESPKRVPRHLWTLPWAEIHFKDMCDKIRNEFEDDIVHAPALLRDIPFTKGSPHSVGEYIDEWGCIFENKQEGIVGEVKNPIITGEDWEDFDNAHIPVELLTFDADAANKFCAETDKFVLAGAYPRPFEQLQFLRGTEALFMDIAMESEGLIKAVKRIHEFYCELLTRWAKTDVDGLFFMDDWGSQQALLINPKAWESIFKPLYKDYASIAHGHNKKIFMHSDGHILSILPHLIEIGIDAVNSQLFCMGLENLEQFAGKITFWGEIDRQWILPYASREEVAAAVKDVCKSLWKDGGCIAQCEFGIGANPENVYTVFRTWDKLF